MMILFRSSQECNQGTLEARRFAASQGVSALVPQRFCGKYIIMDEIMESGWWFGTFFIFPYIGDSHPN